MSGFRELKAYQKAFSLAIEIYQRSKSFPKEERYGLTAQMRNSSRSVCANIGEGYGKRRYEKHFVSKLSDAYMENIETQVWLDFAAHIELLSAEEHRDFIRRSEEVGLLLKYMMNNPGKFKPFD